MTRSWKLQAAAACAALVLIFGAAAAQAVAVCMRPMMKAAEAEAAQPFVAEWATVAQTAPTHDGPGLRHAVNGSLPVGVGVEVVRQENGYCKCLTYLSAEPVWVNGEYLDITE